MTEADGLAHELEHRLAGRSPPTTPRRARRPSPRSGPRSSPGPDRRHEVLAVEAGRPSPRAACVLSAGRRGTGRSRRRGRSPAGQLEAGGEQLGLDLLAPELGADLGADLLAVGEDDGRGRGLDRRPAGGRRRGGASRSTPARRPRRATWCHRVGSKSASQLAVQDPQHVAVELGGDAGGVVVGGDQAAGSFTRSVPSRRRVARQQRGARSASSRARSAGS